jgi:hypothetical protein
MFRHIAWFNEALIEPDPKGGLRSPDARVHRRCLAPACALEDVGIDCSVFGNLDDADPVEVGKLLQKLETDIVVIGSFADASMLNLARAAKHLGCYVVVDFADQDDISAVFQQLSALADQIVVASSQQQALLQKEGYTSAIIPDANSGASSQEAWLDCFKHIKMKPPACANSNTPPAQHD